MHYVNKDTLREIHERQEYEKASGVDGTYKETYEKEIDKNIGDLLSRMKRFSYRPQAVKRVYIPKEGSGKLRPLGIPAYEDKLVQGVMAEILNVIYEPRFYDFSFGFRPRRNCHQAIAYLDNKLMGKTSWVIDADIKGFFDNVNHDWMIKFLEHNISDPNFIRYIKRFLKSGIMEEGKYWDTEKGVPQGGPISPVLANVYLHYVLDTWFAEVVTKKLQGEGSMVRYADDFVLCFQYKEEAQAVYSALKQRLAKFGLELSEEKSSIIKFGRSAGKDAGKFDFLGFTFVTTKSRKGKFIVVEITSQKKLKVKRSKIKSWIKDNMHNPVEELIKLLNIRLGGHYNYYGLTNNYKRISDFYQYVKRQLRMWLGRRSQKGRITWEEFERMLEFYPLRQPKITKTLWRGLVLKTTVGSRMP